VISFGKGNCSLCLRTLRRGQRYRYAAFNVYGGNGTFVRTIRRRAHQHCVRDLAKKLATKEKIS